MKKIILLYTVFAILYTGCKDAETQKEKVFPVKTQQAKREYIANTVTVMGTVQSKVHAWAQSTIEGTVQSLAVREGTRVREGQVLCYIMSQESQNMLGQARLEYEKALREAGNDKSEETGNRVENAKKELAIAKNMFRPVPAVSPVSGTVISKTIENGSTVEVKQKLIEIADLNRLVIKTAVSENVVSKIRRGQRARVTLYGDSEKSINGKVSVVAPGVNLQTRTADVEIGVAKKYDFMKPGMTASVELVTDSRSGALVVPLEAILTDATGNKRVFKVKDGKAVATRIETGIENNASAEVLSGLQPGDEIVVLGQENLKNGVKVSMGKEQAGETGTEGTIK